MIIVSTQCFPPAAGGIESLMYHLCIELERAGERVLVYADESHVPDQAGVDAKQPFSVRRYGGLKPLRRYRKARAIRRNIARHRDSHLCLLADTWKSLELIIAGPGSRTLCLAHGSELSRSPSPRKRRRIQGAYGRADVIVANSHYTAGLLRGYDITPEKIRIINPGIAAPAPDPEQSQTLKTELSDHYPILITVARLERRKGHKQVIETIPSLKQQYPTVLYLVVGEGSERAGLQQRCRELGINENVRFIGKLQGPSKDAYLANSDIFVMPGQIVGNDVEGFGMAYIEAACLGVPAIASDAGGSSEAVLHNQTGLVCAVGNQQQLTESLLRLAGDADLRSRLGERAHSRADGFLWPQKIREYLQLLDRMT